MQRIACWKVQETQVGKENHKNTIYLILDTSNK